MTVTDWSHHVTRVDASRSDEGCKMLLLLCLHTSARTHSSNQCPHVCVLCAHIRVLVQRAAAAAACSLHHCAMHLCVSRDVTNGLPSYTAIYFDFKFAYQKERNGDRTIDNSNIISGSSTKKIHN